MKFIMAILVINIHKPFVSYDVPFVNTIFRTAIGGCAVPFFFMCSAFFLFKKFTNDQKKNNSVFLSFLKRIFILYTLWSVIYLPCNFVKSFTGHYHEITVKLLLGQVIGYAKDFFLSQSFIHFWYMNTLLLSAIFVFVLLKKFSAKTVLIISLAVYFICNTLYYLNVYDSSFALSDIFVRFPIVLKNTLQVGFLCTSLGAYFALGERKITFKAASVLSVLLIIVSIVQKLVLERYIDLSIIYKTTFVCIVGAYFIFIMCAKSNIPEKPIYAKLRAYSSLMYFSHLLLMAEGLNFLAKVTGFEPFSTSFPLAFFLSVFLSLTFAIVVTKLQTKKGFAWLSYLY